MFSNSASFAMPLYGGSYWTDMAATQPTHFEMSAKPTHGAIGLPNPYAVPPESFALLQGGRGLPPQYQSSGGRYKKKGGRMRGGKTPNWMKSAWSGTKNLFTKTKDTVDYFVPGMDAANPTNFQGQVNEYSGNLNTEGAWDQLPSATKLVASGIHRRRQRRANRRSNYIGGAGYGGARERGAIVREVMATHGLSLPHASKFVKDHGLY
jgi:hypothetical protein